VPKLGGWRWATFARHIGKSIVDILSPFRRPSLMNGRFDQGQYFPQLLSFPRVPFIHLYAFLTREQGLRRRNSQVCPFLFANLTNASAFHTAFPHPSRLHRPDITSADVIYASISPHFVECLSHTRCSFVDVSGQQGGRVCSCSASHFRVYLKWVHLQ
jgi:hypothetical protein